ncbi:pyridoxamine 5'-phosphate oxidase family protein [Candidatus Nitrosotenuis aquarius]|uniref:pyridoxamine 5'-phosphate oxidase family protein n=1 Tax=Candidatus Nitrosotenuis aquarius TaxID=1846278 RepID=UPI000C1E5C1F|nr:pyridoxamine 5'-phosphate oxidase family protein [Candidatus Nitrosotenuis aquarius]
MNFSPKEKKFLHAIEEARFATVNGTIPHVKPVSFIFHDDSFYLATDYKTRTYKNVAKNPKAAISIDVYKPGGHKAVLAQGKIKIIEHGPEFKKIYEKFFEKFEWVRRDPWKEDEAPFLKLIPTTKTSWGLS